MAFVVVVEEREEFDRWLSAQAAPASAPSGPIATRGAEAFLESGCGACHAVRGTSADGVVGPDLTHVGSRRSIAAGTLESGAAALRRWLTSPEATKPGVHMPAFDMLPDDDLTAIATFLEELQ
jgi:cytochrome c oxidase subunit 2